MPRHARLEFSNAFYHVFSRGNRREIIFKNNSDYQHFETSLLFLAKNCDIKLFAWCLMPNHIHLLIQTPEANIAYFMKRLMTKYAQYFNHRHHLVGHVFQGRYKAILCDKDSYLLQLVRYIHLNPLKAKKKLISNLNEWEWSSHRYYIGKKSLNEPNQNIQEVLECFSKRPRQALILYSKFIIDGMKTGEWEYFYQPKGKNFLGEEKFIEEVKSKTQFPIRKEVRLPKRLTSIEEIGRKISRSFGIEERYLRANNKTRIVSRIRKAMVFIARRRYRLKARMLAAYLNRDISAISQIVSRAEKQKNLNPELLQIEACLATPS